MTKVKKSIKIQILLYVSSHFFGFTRQASAVLLTFSVTIISSLFSHFNDSDIGECTSENSLLKDSVKNHYGSRLLDLCKGNDLFIINGRIGNDKDIGKLTCKNSSVVDYVIS
jgi:hypothetical protein